LILGLKRHFRSGDLTQFDSTNLRYVTYRPFTARCLYLSDIVVDEPSHTADYFPKSQEPSANRMLVVTDLAGRSQFSVLATSTPVDLHLCASSAGFQCFPFYTYAEDGSHRRENITDWALAQFCARYQDPSITKWDMFHYIYAVLHHPDYRERYAANLRRELPRIPFATSNPCHPDEVESPASPGTPKEGPMQFAEATDAAGESIDPSARKERGPQDDKTSSVSSVSSVVKDFDLFRQLAKAGQRLAEIHVHYEQQLEYPLTKKEKEGEKLDYGVKKMKLSKDKSSLIYNQFLTLSGIPRETYDYRLGNRSALEWVIDQYQVSTDKRSGITNDPNSADDKEYILRLIGQVITVSLETVKIVQSLPPLGLPE
jgi:predicted helicase